MVRWTKENNAKLEFLWDKGHDDIFIAGTFDTGVYAVAKQRSNLGLVKHKHKKGIKRQVRRILDQAAAKPFYAIYYRKDGVNHFTFLDTNNADKAKELARHMIYNQRLHCVTILQPVTQMVCEKITEIKL